MPRPEIDPSALALIAATPRSLRALLVGLPAAVLNGPNAEGWSVKDIVAHLVDVEGIAFVERRGRDLEWLRGLSSDQLRRPALHQDVGEIFVIDIAHQWAAHDMAHLRQVALMLQEHLAPLMGGTRELYDV